MNVLNTTISQFDAELKQLISEKINAELQSAIQTMVAETVPSIVGIKCNEFLNKSHTVLEPICETKYAHYISMCGHFKCKPQPREQIVCYLSSYQHENRFTYNSPSTYIVFRSGKIYNYDGRRFIFDLTHEPSYTFITLMKWCWNLYYYDEPYKYQNATRTFINNIKSKVGHKDIECVPFWLTSHERYRTEITYPYNSSVMNNSHGIVGNADEMIIPLIQLFTKEKPHELNLEVKNLLRLEDVLNVREVELHEREMDISLREMEMDNTLKRLEQEKQEFMHEKNKEIEECKLAKKQIMEKFIAQERQIKQLNKQLEEITELYNVLIG